MAGIRWTTEENNFLIENYGVISKEELLNFLPNRTWSAIKLRAEKYGLKFYQGIHEHVESKLGVLLEDTSLAFYWIGFLLADGHFSKKFRLSLSLAKKDKQHLKKFAEFISCPNFIEYKRCFTVSGQDKFTVSKIVKKFNISSRKTYEPCNINWMTGDLFTSFFIGFVDGDGCIKKQSGGRQDCALAIKVHGSWLENLTWMIQKVSKDSNVKTPNPKINKLGYASVIISNSKILKYLKRFSENLPVLERKWSLIDLYSTNRYEQAIENRNNIWSLKAKGLKNFEISKQLQLSDALVSTTINKKGKQNEK